ncbi:MAG: DNA helicase RecG, partial [Acidimicrobiia bacterium]|nr:DNA helicase RecG [Acidimicrobiia bacterium]
MTDRSLAYLAGISVQEVKGLRGKRGMDLTDAGVDSVAALLMHIPRRYIDRSTQVELATVPVGEEVTVIATVQKVSTRRPRRNLVIVEAQVFDGTAPLKAVWFNQGFRARQLNEGAEVALSGKVERFRGRLQMKSPAVDVLRSGGESLVTGRVVPIHPGVGDASPGYLRRAIHNALGRARPIADPIPEEMADRLDLMSRDLAFASIHFPDAMAEVAAARTRLAFDELFRLEVALALTKRWNASNAVGIEHPVDGQLVADFIAGLPYTLTGAQTRVIDEITADLGSAEPMHRLLQGEVGSGKTVVAVASLLIGVEGGFQGAVMAPTEVLAEQHFRGIADLLESSGMTPGAIPDRRGMVTLFDAATGPDERRPQIRLALLTSSSTRVNFAESISRVDLLKLIADGDIDVVVGTHALIQEGV